MINMSAGQTMLSRSCLDEMSRQMETPIYYPPYWEVEEEVRRLLGELLGAGRSDILLPAGSATFGIEAALKSVLAPGDKVVVLNGGVFGRVMADLVRIVGGVPLEVKVPYGTAPDLDVVRRAQAEPGVKALAAIHVETSTGTIFPVESLGALARERNQLFLVDAISSAGGCAFDMEAWGVDLCFASPQKCLSGPQGLAIVGVSQKAWRAIEARAEGRESDTLCLDLRVWKRYHDVKVRAANDAWKAGSREPKALGRAAHEPSPSGPLVRGLYGALKDLFAEGPANYRKRHDLCSRAVRAGVRALGLRLVATSEAVAAPVVTVFYLPPGLHEKDLRAYLLARWAVAIGNGEIGDDNVRVGTMGVGAQPRNVLFTLAALEDALARFGHGPRSGAAVAAAQAVFDEVS